MKYFKMRESKRKISFIMALALIVSLLPVSPVVKAADVKKVVYIDNRLGDDVVKVKVQESTTVSGSAIVNVTAAQGEFSGTKGEITIDAVPKGASPEVPTAGAFEVSPATNSAISFECSKADYDTTGKVWSATITGIRTDDVVVTVGGTYNPSIVTGPTSTPKVDAVASAGAISDKMLDKLVETKKLTEEQKKEVKAGTATLEFKTTEKLTELDVNDKTAIEKFLEKNPTMQNLVNSFVNAKYSFVFDLKINVIFVKGNERVDLGEVTDLGDVVEITMEIPEACRNTNASKLRTYFVIRLHNGEATRIDCETSGNNFSFKNDKFSKFILCYKDVPSTWGGGATVPPTGTTKPGATATPSASPSASAVPSATPVATTVPTDTDKPTDSATPDVNKPDTGDGSEDGNTSTSGSSSKIKKGQKYTVNGIKYEIISTDSTKTVGFANGKKNSKKITIPATVKIKGKTFKVKSIKSNAFKNSKKLTTLVIGANVKIIEKNAFKGCKNLKKITIKSKKLTAAKVAKNAFKGINKKATVKVPKNKVKAYTKIVKVKGGAGNSVKVTK